MSGWTTHEHPPIPDFEPVRRLARNGYLVYLARQVSTGRLATLKVVACGSEYGEAMGAGVRRHAAVLARFDHPHILRVIATGEVEECVYVALEFMEGGSLAARLRAGPLPASGAAQIAGTIALTMVEVSARDPVHVSLCPDDIFLRGATDPVLGTLYQITNAEISECAALVVPNMRYVAPDQVTTPYAGQPPACLNVYWVGGLLYEMLTGRPPHRGETIAQTIEQVLSQEILPVRQLQPAVPRDLARTCMKCLEKCPDKRYASLQDLARALSKRPWWRAWF